MSFDDHREGILCVFFIPGTMSKGQSKEEEEATGKRFKKTVRILTILI